MKIRSLLLMSIVSVALAGCAPQESPEEPAGLENGSFNAELNGFNIHYEVHGQGPVVMTVPNSWGLSLEGLRALYRPMEEHVTMVYFDPRGMGESAEIREDADMGLAAVRADFDALRRHLDLDKVHAIGWSNGAMNLILLASEMPETLESAIFLHGAASFGEEDMAEWAEAHPDLLQGWMKINTELTEAEIPLEEKTARMTEFYLDEAFPNMFANPVAGKTKIRELFADAEFSWAHSRYSDEESPTFQAVDKLPMITARSLILHGVHDMMQLAKAEEMNAGIPDSTLVVFENSAHFAPVEEPEKYMKTVLEFLGVEGS
jgi:proline iminopeptidase